MNNKVMILLECAGAAAVAGSIWGLVKDARRRAKRNVTNDISEKLKEDRNVFEKAYEKAVNDLDDINLEFARLKGEKMDELEPEYYGDQLDKLKATLADVTAAAKHDISYDERMKVIDSDAEKEFHEALKEMGYYQSLKEANRKIDKANKDFNTQKRAIELAGGDEETMKALKKTAKKSRDAIIEEQKDVIADLKNEYETHRQDILKDKRAKAKAVKDELNGIVNEAKVQYERDSHDLLERHNKNVDEAYEYAFSLKGEELNETKEATDAAKENLEKFKIREKNAIADALKELTDDDMIAAYIKDKGYSKTEVIVVAALPFVPVVHVGYLYFKRVRNILGKM